MYLLILVKRHLVLESVRPYFVSFFADRPLHFLPSFHDNSSSKKTAGDYRAFSRTLVKCVVWTTHPLFPSFHALVFCGRSAKNDTKYGRTDSNTRWRLTKIRGYIKSRAFNFSSLNDVIFQPMRSLDLRIRDHVSISAGTL